MEVTPDIDYAVLQDKIKRQPTLYLPEFKNVLSTFQKLYQALRDEPAKPSPQANKVLFFLSNLSNLFPNDLLFLKTEIVTTLEQYYTVLHCDTLMAFVKSLILLRQKAVLSPQIVIPLLIKLNKCENKKIREIIEPTIIGELKKMKKKKQSQHAESQIQIFMIDLISSSSDKSAKLALKIFIEAYRKGIWKDQKVINGISKGCLSNNKKMCRMACSFFLITNFKPDDAEDDSENEESKKHEINKLLTSKLPKKKKAELKITLKSLERKANRKVINSAHQDFFPIDLLYDPQSLSEKLLSKAKSGSDRFEVKALMISLIARLVGRHKLILPNFYPFIQKYLHPKQYQLPKILAALCESSHDRVPPDDVKPIMIKVIENFINETGNPENITMGINTIREICARIPYALDEKQVSYLVDFRSFKNKSVTAAARSLINLFRDIYPNMLQAKLRGLAKAEEGVGYGELKIKQNIEGVDLIDKTGDITKEKILDDSDLKKIKILAAKEEARKMGKMKGKAMQDIIGETMSQLQIKLLGKRASSDSEESKEEDESEEEHEEEKEKEIEPEESDISENMDEVKEIEEIYEGEDEEDDGNHSSQEEGSDVEGNQGFVSEDTINTFKKTRKQKKIDEVTEEKEKFTHHKKDKAGSTTNKEKLKSKPYMMILPKRKEKLKKMYRPIKERVHDLKKGQKVREGKILVHKKKLKLKKKK